MFKVLLFVCLLTLAFADVYMHNPRGSNDRLNEKNQNRQNANRLFDSQNNAAGGYAWGPPMSFYVGSRLEIQWTAQHSCGVGANNCEIILQYMCDEHVGDPMRDGETTDTIPNTNDPATTPNQNDLKYGRQESYAYYQECSTRERNRGLFTADQNLGNSATSTRQNAGANRHGFECTEERDYYPYWHPSPWVDIAILTSNVSRCPYYKAESQNVKGRNYCTKAQYNNAAKCQGPPNNAEPGQWNTKDAWSSLNKGKETVYGPPDCLQAAKARDNHLGSADNLDGKMANYMWVIPNTPSKSCTLRLRYNISTQDFDPWVTFADRNNANSPVKNNPVMPVANGCGSVDGVCNMTMALNTNQYGRTFQDRSYQFAIIARPSNVTADAVIWNVNIRGKRGNIVQTYPAVEYDFTPSPLQAALGEYLHFQWTGSDFNANNGNNNAEGTDGTDRHNICEILGLARNRPVHCENNTFFQSVADCVKLCGASDQYSRPDPSASPGSNKLQCQSYQELMVNNNFDADQVDRDVHNCMKLNAASNYFNMPLIKIAKAGEFYIFSTRNNNFSNRAQKGTIIINALLPNWALALIGIGGGLLVLGAGALVLAQKGMLPFFNGA